MENAVRRLSATIMSITLCATLMIFAPHAQASSDAPVSRRASGCGFDVNTIKADATHPRMRLGVKEYGSCYPGSMQFRLRARPYWVGDDGRVRYGRWRTPDFNVI